DADGGRVLADRGSRGARAPDERLDDVPRAAGDRPHLLEVSLSRRDPEALELAAKPHGREPPQRGPEEPPSLSAERVRDRGDGERRRQVAVAAAAREDLDARAAVLLEEQDA